MQFLEVPYRDTIGFIEDFKNQLGIDSDYDANKLQIQTIETIREHIGLDIIKNESIAGTLSVYKRLPAFYVGGNFNAERGDRYVTIVSLEKDKRFDNAFVNIDILDDKKILFNVLTKFEDSFKVALPTIEMLEQFSELCVSIMNFDNDNYHKIFEETFHLIRSFSIGMSIGGGHSKIVRNRFIMKEQDKIPLYDHVSSISNKGNKDFFNYDNDYRLYLHGTKNEYLFAEYFSNDSKGRKLFLKFIRNTFASAKSVTVIDAYFDNMALDDILACSTNRFDLSIVTTKCKNAQSLVENIYAAFPESKVFFTEKIHDRYLYIDDGMNEKLYSLSNSWNGLVNNYNLYIQEVPYKISLQIYDEIQKYITDDKLQARPKPVKRRLNNYSRKTKYTKAYIESIANAIQQMPSNGDAFIEIACEYYMAHYYKNISKTTICAVINNAIQKFAPILIDDIITRISFKMLEKQKRQLEEDQEFIDGKSFNWYDTPQKCYSRLANDSFHGGPRSYTYSIDYGLSELLNLFFQKYPSRVIPILQEQEDIVCQHPAYINDENGTHAYRVSECIINSFLNDLYPIDGILSEKLKIFINKANGYVYNKIFFANILTDKAIDINGQEKTFQALIEQLKILRLSSEELAVILGGMYNRVSLLNRNAEFKESIQREIVRYILAYISGDSAIVFAYYAYISSYDIKVRGFNEFCDGLKNHKKDREAKLLQKLFLLDAVHTNLALQARIAKIIAVDVALLSRLFQTGSEEPRRDKFSESDIRKYIPFIPYLSGILAECVGIDDANEFDSITNALRIDKNLMFNIKYPSEIGLFYYDFYLLLRSIIDIPNTNVGKTKLLSLARWYLPVCLKNAPNDFFGLAIKIIGIYSIIINDKDKKELLKYVDYLPIKALLQCLIANQEPEYLSCYDELINNSDVDSVCP